MDLSVKRHPIATVLISGVVVLLVGFAMFLQSLGSGDGELAMGLMAIGMLALLASLVAMIVRAIRRRDSDKR